MGRKRTPTSLKLDCTAFQRLTRGIKNVMQVLERGSGAILSLCYAADGSNLVGGCKDQWFHCWGNPEQGILATGSLFQSIDSNSAGDWLIGMSNEWNLIRACNDHEWTKPEKVRRDIGATSVAFLNDDLLVIGYGNRIKPEPGAIELWTADMKIRKQPHFHAPYGVRSVATHRSGCIAWSEWGSRTETGPRLYLWEIAQQDRIRYNLAGECSQVAFHPDGRLLALTNSWQISIYDRKHNTIATQLTGHKGIVSSIAFHPDGRTLASGSWDKTIRIWDVETWTEVRSFRSMVGKIFSLAYAPDGLQLTAGGDSGNIMVIDTE